MTARMILRMAVPLLLVAGAVCALATGQLDRTSAIGLAVLGIVAAVR